MSHRIEIAYDEDINDGVEKHHEIPTLPDLPSQLIEIALADLERVEAMRDEYAVDMSSVWHSGRRMCSVCFAGAVMSQTLGSPRDSYLRPLDFDPRTAVKLDALNTLRCGYVEDAVDDLVRGDILTQEQADRIEDDLAYFDVPSYSSDSEKFKQAMRKMATQLKEVGL